MLRWKGKDIKYDTVKFTFWIHFILVLIPHRLQVSDLVNGLENLEIISPHKLRLQRIFSNTQCFPSWHFFLYISDVYFFLACCVVLSIQQDLLWWHWNVMASLHPQNNSIVRARWVEHLAGSASLLHERHTVVAPSQSPCIRVIVMLYTSPI